MQASTLLTGGRILQQIDPDQNIMSVQDGCAMLDYNKVERTERNLAEISKSAT